jgi:hypothetical protein
MLVELARGRDLGPGLASFRADLWMTNFEEAIYLDADRAVVRPSDVAAKSGVSPFNPQVLS